MKKRILIKISGAAIRDDKHKEIFDLKKLEAICNQIKQINKTNSVGVVLGGGNIWRGNMTKNNAFRRANADYMGMMSTVINGLAFKETLHRLGVKAEIYTSLEIEKITFPLSITLMNDDLAKGKVLIFVGGTGHPYFTTDTACAIRAIDMHATTILMGKDGVDGVYSADPKKNKKAKKYKSISYLEAINKELKVMDLTAMSLCQDNDVEIIVFDVASKNGIVNAYKRVGKFTRVHK